jgi:hypothetical protein
MAIFIKVFKYFKRYKIFKVLRGVVSIHRSSDILSKLYNLLYGPDGLPLPYPVLIINFILEGHVVPSHII